MSGETCILCNQNTDDTLQFGEKVTCEDTTAHYYCLLLTSNLMQNGEDNEGMLGFLPKDVKKEVNRTKKLVCHYCQLLGATIGCCAKSCRKSFHLPCALKNDCRLEFHDPYQSYCDAHVNIKKPKNAHKPSDLCTICSDEMGEYNLIQSIPLPCCNKNAWCHKICLQQYAQTAGYFLKCPLCNASDSFREWIARRGVFIPDRDAKWEVDENGPNSFYGFEQHSERPVECEAEKCRCRKGRKFQVDAENDKYSMIYCEHCGSHAIHLGCLTVDEDFLCVECTVIEKRRIENAANQARLRRLEIERMLIAKHNLRECSISVRRLTAQELGFKLEPSSSIECNTTVTKSNAIQTNNNLSGNPIEISSSDDSTLPHIISIDSDSDSDLFSLEPARNHPFYSHINESPNTANISDINDNSKDMLSSNLTTTQSPTHSGFLCEQSCKQSVSSLKIRQISSSQPDDGFSAPNDNQIKSTCSKIQNENQIFFDSSDDQVFGKENERPRKSIAIIRPFSNIQTSSDNCNKPSIILNTQRHPMFSSSDEQYDEHIGTSKMEVDESRNSVNHSITTNLVKSSPVKRKRQSLLPFSANTPSSEDEPITPKIRKRSPKKIRTHIELEPNQSTIKDFFKMKPIQNQPIQ